MDNLRKVLSEIALGPRRAGRRPRRTRNGGDRHGAAGAVRLNAAQLRAVAGAARRDGVKWSRIEDEIGVDAKPEPEPLIQIHFAPGDVEEMAWGSGVPLATAMSWALRWAPAIAASAIALCASQLLSVVRTDNPWAAGAPSDTRGQGSRR